MEEYTLATPAPVKAPPTSSETPPPNKLKRILIIAGILIGFIVFFMLGMLMSGGRSSSQQTATVTPTDEPTPTTRAATGSITPAPVIEAGSYRQGKEYHDDTVTIVTKTEPYRILSVGVSRIEQDKNFSQYTKVNYYTGSGWLRENVNTTIQRSEIVVNPLLRRWSISPSTIRNSQNSNGIEIMIENKPVTFTLSKLSTDIASQAYSGYTKFHYFGEGTLKSTEDEQPAYIMYTKAYSRHASDVAFLNTPEKLESDWFVFWDASGNAYFGDVLSSTEPSKQFQNYSVGILATNAGIIEKSSQVRVQQRNAGNQYTASLSFVSPVTLNVAVSGVLNKSASRAFTWQLGVITGTTQTDTPVNGVGVIETIHATR